MKNKIAKFVKESVEWLIAEQEGCCTYKLDEHLAVCVGWSQGYGDEKRNDVIQGIDEPDFAINAGIKVWTSDATMLTDYDWINFPYEENGDVFDMDCAVSPQEDWDRIAKYLLKMYDEVKELDMTDKGMILPREVEYNVVCFERTLKIKFSKGSNIDKNQVLKSLDKHYDEWQDDDQGMCLEEYMVNEVCDDFDVIIEEWESIPYGEDYEPREHLWVCDHCLMAIESREGNQARLTHSVDETDAVDSRCDWCKLCGFDTLYELV